MTLAKPTGSETLTIRDIERFTSKIIRRPNACWEMTDRLETHGYARFWVKSTGNSRKAYRVLFELVYGKLPAHINLDHLCRNRACVNFSHVEPVTHAENILRGVGPTAVRARQTHCIHGHELSGSNLKISKEGYRNCLKCRVINRRRYYLNVEIPRRAA